MEELSSKEWSDFKISHLFPKIVSTKGGTTSGLISGEGLPYIPAAKSIVGCQVCSFSANKEWKSDGNGIVFVQLGDGAAGLTHYIPMPFIGMSGKTSVGYSDALNSSNGLFIARCLSSNKSIFSHGYSWTGKRLLNTRALLPVDDIGNPDYKYMEEYVSEIKYVKQNKYREYAAKQIAKLEYKDIPNLSEKDWKKFKLFGDKGIIDINTTNSSIDAVRLIGLDNMVVPYITRTNTNNGISKFVSSDNFSYGYDEPGCIVVGLDTQTAFWQPYRFVTGQNIHIISGANLNKYIAQFLVLILRKQMQAKFNWGGNGATLKRMKSLDAMLPIDDAGNPDYAYMEQYIKNLMLRKYEQYISFINV